MDKIKRKNNQCQLYNLLLLLNTTNLVFSLGKKIFNVLPKIDDFFSKSTDLAKLGLSLQEIKKLQTPNHEAVEQALLWMEQKNHHIIPIYDDRYPGLLKEIPNPPVLLFAAGDINLLKKNQISVVGSRNPTPAGIEISYNFAKELASVGVVITSGFAAGIDAAAHQGVISGEGKTVAVMGAGLNHIYPRHQLPLYMDIINAGGVVVSEFPLDDKAKAWHFPLRNRIISGLSIGTIVIEAALRSGSLITARLAAEQGREVFAVPGSIYNPKSRGCHYLIRQGAKLVEKIEDILEEFPNYFVTICHESIDMSSRVRTKNKLDCQHKKLLDCMGFERVTIDVLISRANMSISQVSAMLLDLEMQGLISSVLGGYLRI